MAIRFVKGGVQSYRSAFEKSKLGQAYQKAQQNKGGGQVTTSRGGVSETATIETTYKQPSPEPTIIQPTPEPTIKKTEQEKLGLGRKVLNLVSGKTFEEKIVKPTEARIQEGKAKGTWIGRAESWLETKTAKYKGTATMPSYVTIPFQKGGEAIVSVAQKVSKPIEKKLGKKYPSLTEPRYTKEQAREEVADILKFGFFSPGMLTTAETEISQLPQETRVKFRGVEQEVKEGVVRTKVRFQTSQGEIGRAVGITKNIPTEESIQKSVSITAIEKGKPAIAFPTAKPTIYGKTSYVSVQKSIAKPTSMTIFTEREGVKVSSKVEDAFRYITGGLTKEGGMGSKIAGQPERFSGLGVGFKQNEITYLFGKSMTKQGRVFSAGTMTKDVSDTFSEVMTAGTKGISKTVYAKIALQDVSSAISSTAKPISGGISPKTMTSNVIGKLLISIPMVKAEPKQVQKQAGITIVSEIQKEQPRTKIAQVSRVTPKERQHQVARELEMQIPRENQAQKQKIKQMTKQLNRTFQIQTPRQPPKYITPFFNFPIMPRTKLPFLAGWNLKPEKYGKTKKTDYAKRIARMFRAYQPSVAAVQLGIYGKPKKKLTGLEIRPMIRERKDNYLRNLKKAFSL